MQDDIGRNAEQGNSPITFKMRMRIIGPISCWVLAAIMVSLSVVFLTIIFEFDPQDDYLNIGEFSGKILSFLGLIIFGLIAFFSAIIGILWFVIGKSNTKKEKEAEQAKPDQESSED
jgi:hypothetical protein